MFWRKRKKKDVTAVVIAYSFDPEVAVVLCRDYREACRYIRRDFDNERRIDVEENGWEIDETVTKCEDGFAVLGTIYPSQSETQTVTWQIATLYDRTRYKSKKAR